MINEVRDNINKAMTTEDAYDICHSYVNKYRDTLLPNEAEALGIALVTLADCIAMMQESITYWHGDRHHPGSVDISPDTRRRQLEERQRREADTALNEVATARLWEVLEPRLEVTLILKELSWRGYVLNDVALSLFHKDEMSLERLATLVVANPGRAIEQIYHSYIPSQIDDTFSKSEARQLIRYFGNDQGIKRIRIERAKPPKRNYIGDGAVAVGGPTDFLMLDEDPDYSLPFKVWGFYDVRPALDKLSEAK